MARAGDARLQLSFISLLCSFSSSLHLISPAVLRHLRQLLDGAQPSLHLCCFSYVKLLPLLLVPAIVWPLHADQKPCWAHRTVRSLLQSSLIPLISVCDHCAAASLPNASKSLREEFCHGTIINYSLRDRKVISRAQ